ncbi:heat-shock protein [Methanolobus chelungpuianus]|uniref:Heat-shock protein n=1 Tax=Methanolobus chelungpuianus TaxID=502115 RepID=A0AAE3HAE4_9EURY|nr:heat-shock protein [Methanolobus chelungpuianus]MCQ6962966.1 heat-shock protein [Methanolobus chelungpuianus]
MKMELNADNPFVQALAVSTVMALFMISVALGIMNMASNVAASSDTTPVPTAVILLIFAVVFIAGSVFFESRGADYIGSMVGGAIASFIATFVATAFFTGVTYALNGGIRALWWEQILSALAVCMVASMFIIRLLQHKLQSSY